VPAYQQFASVSYGARYECKVFEQGTRIGARLELTQVNGQPGALAYDG
jgi:hypothetical protein